MAEFRTVAPGFSVAPQLSRADVAEAARQGYRTIVNNRPDGESADQPGGAEIAQAAEAAGLAYRAIPIAQPTPEAIEATVKALGETDGPILAFCRSGTRSTTLWALAQAKRKALPPAQILNAAAAAGYDLSALRPRLDALYEG